MPAKSKFRFLLSLLRKSTVNIDKPGQIAAIFVFPALLAVVLIGWFLHSSLHHWAVDRWAKDHSAFVNSVARQIESDLQDSAKLLAYTASLPAFSTLPHTEHIDKSINGIPLGVDAQKRRQLDQLMAASDFSVLFVLKPNGEHYLSHPYSVQRSLKKYDLSSRAYFQQATRSKQLVISDSFIGADGVPAVAIDVPILNERGEIIAHLGGVKYLHRMSNMLQALHISPFERAYLIDRSGKTIAATGIDNQALQASRSPVQAAARHATHEEQAAPSKRAVQIDHITDETGKRWLYFGRQLDTQWTLQLLRQVPTLKQEIAPQIQNILYLAIGIMLLTSAAGALFALRLSKRWQTADRELQEINATLEQRVVERTAELERSETRHRTLFEATADAVLLLNREGIVDCNLAAVRIFGASSKRQLLIQSLSSLSPQQQIDGERSERLCERHMADASAKGNTAFEWVYQRVDNQCCFYAEVLLSHMLIDGTPLLQATVRDISVRMLAEQRIRTLSLAVEQSPVSVIIADNQGKTEYVNSAFEKTTGYSEREVIGEQLSGLLSDATLSAEHDNLWHAIETQTPWQGEFQHRRKDGSSLYEHVYIAPVLDDSQQVKNLLAVVQDITLQKQQKEQILKQAHYDSLTGLTNRQPSLDRLSQMLQQSALSGKRVAVLFLDMDDFKKVNDTLGHDIGDQLLQEVSTRLQTVVRQSDSIGRLGGDEFIVLLDNLSQPEDARPVAIKLLACFQQPFQLGNRKLLMTASIGIAVSKHHNTEMATLLRNADMAMYQSKRQGRNQYHYYSEEMNSTIERQLLLEEKLHNALEKGELSVDYQPVVDIASAQVVGAEALLRWHCPELGQVSPEEFIPILERTGKALPVGDFVMTEVMGIACALREYATPDFKIAINLSPRQFSDPDLVDKISDSLNAFHLQGQNLEIEITEGVLLGCKNEEHTRHALEQLSRLGISIAMDDFGTGYSSLSHLRKYHFDTLKIDHSFIRDIAHDPASEKLVGSAIAMAHALGLKVVAEGVETHRQLKLLKKYHCDFAQGHLLSHSLSPQAMLSTLGTRAKGLPEASGGDFRLKAC